MQVLLISTYDLGHQPFSLASPAAKLSNAGAEVICNDLAVESLNDDNKGAVLKVAKALLNQQINYKK